ncbi:hypothetical protein RFI_02805 [Reticulomyxa filosa]|uniref:Uncharacterized protein n=1 Tax=Reticulomyxa filosa TaxID=46433 RepID=X6P892_RETFI|nr:hypothetical protein RFI_02805 [Reticulomyxa filosa]|eukprot:ETO34294.1 hypothetical protein RFI_02805 [Reticulomyxa filosa]
MVDDFFIEYLTKDFFSVDLVKQELDNFEIICSQKVSLANILVSIDGLIEDTFELFKVKSLREPKNPQGEKKVGTFQFFAKLLRRIDISGSARNDILLAENNFSKTLESSTKKIKPKLYQTTLPLFIPQNEIRINIEDEKTLQSTMARSNKKLKTNEKMEPIQTEEICKRAKEVTLTKTPKSPIIHERAMQFDTKDKTDTQNLVSPTNFSVHSHHTDLVCTILEYLFISFENQLQIFFFNRMKMTLMIYLTKA